MLIIGNTLSMEIVCFECVDLDKGKRGGWGKGSETEKDREIQFPFMQAVSPG